MPVGITLYKFRAFFEPTEAVATAYMDEIAISGLDTNPGPVQAVAFLKK